MWFFDSVLEEAPKTSNPMISKKDSQDGSFLIMSEAPVTTADIPDTAVQLFDSTIVSEAPSSEVSFFAEPTVEATETSTPETTEVETSEIAFFEESAVDPVAETIEPVEAITSTETENLISFIEESEPVASVVMTETKTEAPSEKDNINAPLEKAITEYNTMLERHSKIAASKDAEIADFNAQVAIAKEGAKKALGERKNLETEMDRIRQMKELFSAQLR